MTVKWLQRGKAAVLVGGQFGSEGKGLVAAFLSKDAEDEFGPYHIATTNAGAQAGHTTKSRDGKSFVCYHLPTAGVMNSKSTVFINAGSIIDIASLMKEIEDTNVDPNRILIHPSAAVITDHNKAEEGRHAASTTKIASTQKGVGAAISDKVMRRASVARDWAAISPFVTSNNAFPENYAFDDNAVSVEVPQGTGLSINHSGMYPYTTSRDCWVGSGLNDAGIHPSFLGSVCMVVRTYPIRVGAIYNEQGEKLGDSGPFFPDSVELNWGVDFPSIEPERTTVTKRVRRIATWSRWQYRHALALNRPDIVALTFCDYLESLGHFRELVNTMVEDEWRVLGRETQKIYSYSPYTEDMKTSFSEVFMHMKGTGKW